jgi:hypothetical protein
MLSSPPITQISNQVSGMNVWPCFSLSDTRFVFHLNIASRLTETVQSTPFQSSPTLPACLTSTSGLCLHETTPIYPRTGLQAHTLPCKYHGDDKIPSTPSPPMLGCDQKIWWDELLDAYSQNRQQSYVKPASALSSCRSQGPFRLIFRAVSGGPENLCPFLELGLCRHHPSRCLLPPPGMLHPLILPGQAEDASNRPRQS